MNSLQTGFARVNITPMLGIGMSGYYHERHADGVRDQLEINVLALACGDTKALLISMDLLGVPRECAIAFREHIAEITGISKEAVYIHGTHIHTGPFLEKDSEKPLEQEYYQFVYRRIGDAACLALEDLKPTRMGFAIAKAPEVAFIRRFRMKDGSVQTNPGINNPDIVEAIGGLDERINVLRFDRENAEGIVLVNFGNHPDVVGGTRFSADWPGFLRREVERSLPESKCIFFTGAQGDVNHINVHPKEGELDPLTPAGDDNRYRFARYMGRAMAGAVLQVYDRVKYTEVDAIRFGIRTIQVPSNMPRREDMEEAYRIMQLHEAGRGHELPYKGMEYVTVVAEAKRMVQLEHGPEAFDMDLSAVAIGKVVFIGLPGEPFTGIGVALKDTPGWDLVLPTCLTNGYHGYFPMQDAFEEGGYEARSSRFREGVDVLLIEEGKRLMESLE